MLIYSLHLINVFLIPVVTLTHAKKTFASFAAAGKDLVFGEARDVLSVKVAQNKDREPNWLAT